MATFTVGDQYAGKSLYNIFDEANLAGEYTPRMDVIQNATGLTRNDPLKAGQTFSYGDDPGSGEYQFLSKKFGAPGSGIGQSGQSGQTAQSVVQPAIDTLKSGIDPLKQKYQDLIASIKGKGAEAVRQTEIASAREFGKRGIPLSSGAYDQFVQSQTLPVNTQYAGLEAETGLAAQNAEQNIKNAIAELQGQAGFKGMDMDLALKQLAQQQSQFQTQEQRLRDAQVEAAKQQGIQTSVITADGRQKLVNTQTGQVIADLGASKTESGSGGGLDLSALIKQVSGSTIPPKPTAPPNTNTTTGKVGGYGYSLYNA